MLIPPKKFLEALVKDNVIDETTASKYEIESIQLNLPIEEFLLQQTNVKKEIVLKTKADFLNVAFVDIATAAIDPQALSLIPESVARRYSVAPYSYDPKNEIISLATADPLNIGLSDFLEKKTNKKIQLALADDEDILKAINLSYSQGLSPEVKEALKEVTPTRHEQAANAASTTIREAPMAKIVNTILEFAVKSRASDIHIEPQEIKTRVRSRMPSSA